MPEPLSSDLLPGTLYLMILRTLRSGPLHGYAIAKRIKGASQELLDIDDGSLYPALNRMLVRGWLKAEWGISENNRSARFYRLTPQGKAQLDSEAKRFDQMIRAVQLVLRTV
ncbi:MAG TPA: PadR family transcriptional regulator [Vicinamibacterales bacterium]|nr:PadR family transcriptional regulator [Vicinamibacterales bacterium]